MSHLDGSYDAFEATFSSADRDNDDALSFPEFYGAFSSATAMAAAAAAAAAARAAAEREIEEEDEEERDR